MRWLTIGALVLIGWAVGLLIGLGLHSDPVAPAPAGRSLSELKREKLQQEIRQLQISNQQDGSPQHTLLAWAPFITGLGAVAAVGATLWKQAADLKSARTELRDAHEQTRLANEHWQERFLEDQRSSRTQEQEASLRRFDANLSMVITNLGSTSETLKVNAAAALGTYLKPRYADFHIDLLYVVMANLQLQPSAQVARVLGTSLERLLRLIFSRTESYGEDAPRELDLARASLRRLDISGLDLQGTVIDIAFADLSQASLAGANLFRLRGREAHLERAHCSRAILREARLDSAYCRGIILHDANLVSASMKNADLRDAQFMEAKMQGAHLDGANLAGADFTTANLADTYFKGSHFDESALQSIALGALNWRDQGHFDDEVRRDLERLAAAGDGHAGDPAAQAVSEDEAGDPGTRDVARPDDPAGRAEPAG